jgi:hypothetical protein
MRGVVLLSAWYCCMYIRNRAFTSMGIRSLRSKRLNNVHMTFEHWHKTLVFGLVSLFPPVLKTIRCQYRWPHVNLHWQENLRSHMKSLLLHSLVSVPLKLVSTAIESRQATSVLTVEVWLTSWLVMVLSPSLSLLIAPAQTDGEHKPQFPR